MNGTTDGKTGWRRWMPAAVAGALLGAAGSGCMAVNAGKPEVFTAESPAGIRAVGSPQVTSRTPRATVAMTEADGHPVARIGLAVDVTTEQPRVQEWERVTVTKQRRLAFGLYPEAAEVHLRPEESLGEQLHDMNNDAFEWGVMLGIFLYTPWALLGEPFLGSWECRSHSWTGPNSELLWERFPAEEIARMGIQPEGHGFLYGFTHAALLGFHRYSTYVVGGPEPSPRQTAASSTVRKETRAVEGPFRVELNLMGLDYSRIVSVQEGEREARFDMINVDSPDPTAQGYVRFLPPAGGWAAIRDAGKRESLMAVAAKSYAVTVGVSVHAPPDGKRPPGLHFMLVNEKGEMESLTSFIPDPEGTDHPEEAMADLQSGRGSRGGEARKPEAPPYRVEKTVDRNGRAVWRVEILAGALTAFDVDREVKPRILQELRDDFAGRNPDRPLESIRPFATYTTEDGGRTLVYAGVAESLVPSLESLTYSAETHRGTVTMRLADGADLRRSKEFVRGNISAIVCDKNVVLTAGARPPDGATYRSLDENFADGVLTVEFEAVE